jgi:hypothetical protein
MIDMHHKRIERAFSVDLVVFHSLVNDSGGIK